MGTPRKMNPRIKKSGRSHSENSDNHGFSFSNIGETGLTMARSRRQSLRHMGNSSMIEASCDQFGHILACGLD